MKIEKNISQINEDTLIVQVQEQTQHCDKVKGNNSKSINAKLWFLHSACCLIFIAIYMKFGEDILNGLQVRDDTIL